MSVEFLDQSINLLQDNIDKWQSVVILGNIIYSPFFIGKKYLYINSSV